jgi:probable rRNA maturation factor
VNLKVRKLAMELVVINQARVPRTQIDFLSDWCRKIDSQLSRRGYLKSLKNKSLTVAFLEEKPAQKLNQQFRGRNYATDVLSFEASESSSLGELVLCWPVLKKQAKEHGHTQNLEMGYMVLHGVLHLLGFDHEGEQSNAEEMFLLQDQMFEAISLSYVNRRRSSSRQKKNPRSRSARS